jgi:hypothetical protein
VPGRYAANCHDAEAVARWYEITSEDVLAAVEFEKHLAALHTFSTGASRTVLPGASKADQPVEKQDQSRAATVRERFS